MEKNDLKTINFSSGQSEVSTISLDSFSLSDHKSLSISRVINWQLSKRRSGSANIKTMSEISGTTKKPYKQKGTGNARQGSKRSVQFVGGRTCHGPRSRSFEHSLPRKIIKECCFDVIKSKISDKKLILASGLENIEIKTSKLLNSLNKNKLNSVLIISDSQNKNLFKSALNIKNVKALPYQAINVYDLLKYNFVIFDNNVFEKNFLGELSNG